MLKIDKEIKRIKQERQKNLIYVSLTSGQYFHCEINKATYNEILQKMTQENNQLRLITFISIQGNEITTRVKDVIFVSEVMEVTDESLL